MANSKKSNKKYAVIGIAILLITSFFVITNSDNVSAEIKPGALSSGYHNFLYTNLITNLDIDAEWIDVVGVGLFIQGDLRAVNDRFEVNESGVHFDGNLIGGNQITDIQLTSANYDGNRGGYIQAHDICQNIGNEYYVCNELEIDNYQRRHSVTLSGTAWVIGGGRKVLGVGNFNSPNDCDGFTTNSNAVAGSFWNFDLNRGVAGPCNQELKIACCRGG